MNIILPLTEQEADTLARLIDCAVKAEGIVAAVAAVPVFQKLQDAAKKAKELNSVPAQASV